MRKKTVKRLRQLCLSISLLVAGFCGYQFYPTNQGPKTFTEAKRIARKIHQDTVTFYCGCPIDWQIPGGRPDLAACDYQPRQDIKRAQRIEWEHVVPAWQFGHQRTCWKQGGRSACAQDPEFNRIEADLHNLQPAIGEINGDRKHYAFAEWAGGHFNYGRCQFKIDTIQKRAQPPERARGAIARTYLYMRDRYQLSYTLEQLKTLQRWHKRYPVTKWECERDRRITAHQGNHNSYVQQACHNR